MKNLLSVLPALLITSLIFITACTQNQRAKSFGGTATIELKPNRKLLEATWKNEDLWYLTREMREGEKAEKYEFIEGSSLGIMEGTVIFIESKNGESRKSMIE